MMDTSPPRAGVSDALAARLAAIREKLARLRALDVKLEVFGAANHRYLEQPPLDAAALAALETACGTSLPEELRAFVQLVHGGGPGPGYSFGLETEPAPRGALPFPYGARDLALLHERRKTDPYASFDLVESGPADEGWPPGVGFMALSEQGCGVTDAIVLTGELRGTMWCCDMAWRPYDCGFLDWYERWLDANLGKRDR